VLGALAAASGVALTATAGWLIVRAAEQPPVLVLMVAIVGVRTFGLARPALRYAERLVSHDVALRLLAERRAGVYDALVPLVPGRLGKQRGDVLTSVVDDVDALVDKHLRVRAPLVTYGLVGLVALAVAALVLPAAGPITLGVLVVGGGGAYLASRVGVARAEPRVATARGRLGAVVVQTLQGAPDLLAWQATGHALDEIDGTGREIGACAGRSARALATGRALAVLAAGGGVGAMAWVTAAGLDADAVSGPMAALLVLLPLALLDVTSPLADAGALQVRTRAADVRLAALTAADPLVTDPAAPADLAAESPHLVLQRVVAGWSERPVLRDLDLELTPGTRLGVVGPSGCGKSTLAATMLRFLDPHSGSIRFGDQDLRGLRLDDVRRTVGLVDDDPHVFASSLRENLRLARPDASTDEIVEAVRAAQLGPWIDTLPRGLDTMVGDGHAHVSGGERARIGLARAVLAGAPVLVLDEPTAHLDTGTAQAVTDALLAAGDGRTVVWITHGSVGLDRMDRVLDLGVRDDAAHPSETAALAVAG
jgi:ATP-binding cassette subfamily C protein CydCD